MSLNAERRDWPVGAPQSWEEVRPFEIELRRLDERLRIQWNPRAVMVKRGLVDVGGKLLGSKFDGRWEIILPNDPFASQTYRNHTLVCRVTTPVTTKQGGMEVPAMLSDGPYAPVGQWLVDFMRAADRHNRDELMKLSERLDAANAARDAAVEASAEEGSREAAAQVWHDGTKAGGGVSEFHPVAIDVNAKD